MMPDSQLLSFSADSIVDTVREPMLVLNADLRVRRANRSFYRTFRVTPEETVDAAALGKLAANGSREKRVH
jgi:PAS domain-containing protein